MASAGAVAAAGTPTSEAAGGGIVPFWYGSNVYARKFSNVPYVIGANAQPFEGQIPPQGYMSAVRLTARSTGGAGGTVSADGPFNVFASMELDDVDGANIQYPMPGITYFLGNLHFRPWDGDPTRRFDYAKSANPSFSLSLKPELRHTAGVLANTDARSQYKLAYTVNTLANMFSSAPATAPTVTIAAYLEVWAQPDTSNLQGSTIDPIPPGLALQTKRRHQTGTLNAAGANNTMQLSLTGNEVRAPMIVTRDNTNARADLLTDPINWMLDNRNLGVFSPDEVFNLMNDFYVFYQDGSSSRPTGTYVWPRFYDPGRMVGQSWLGTTNATYIIFESASAASLSAAGTWEIVVDEAIPTGPLDSILYSI